MYRQYTLIYFSALPIFSRVARYQSVRTWLKPSAILTCVLCFSLCVCVCNQNTFTCEDHCYGKGVDVRKGQHGMLLWSFFTVLLLTL